MLALPKKKKKKKNQTADLVRVYSYANFKCYKSNILYTKKMTLAALR